MMLIEISCILGGIGRENRLKRIWDVKRKLCLHKTHGISEDMHIRRTKPHNIIISAQQIYIGRKPKKGGFFMKSNKKVIAIDHGNRNIKTQNHVFPAGYIECGHLPNMGGES